MADEDEPVYMLDGPGAFDIIYSPVCTYCVWWHPSDGRHCAAWPPGGRRKKIPDSIWNGKNFHITPIGGEMKDTDGQPIVFRLHTDVKRTPENAALLDAYRGGEPNDRR